MAMDIQDQETSSTPLVSESPQINTLVTLTSATPKVSTADNDNATTIYNAICTSYHALEDLRMRFLGFLPLASSAGIFYLVSTTNIQIANSAYIAIGIVGALITIGLYCYELRALQMSHELREVGASIETSALHVVGQFAWHRQQAQHRHGIVLGNTFGSAFVYTAVLTGWLYLAIAHIRFFNAIGAVSVCGILALVIAIPLNYRANPAIGNTSTMIRFMRESIRGSNG